MMVSLSLENDGHEGERGEFATPTGSRRVLIWDCLLLVGESAGSARARGSSLRASTE